MTSVYILGGSQTDFAVCWSREGKSIDDMMAAAVQGALSDCALEPGDIEVAHVGNFTAELFCRQGQLGGFLAAMHPAFDGIPTARHEAACASGSMAILAASAELEAGRYDVACVVGVEQMRNVPGAQAAEYLGVAAAQGREAENARYLWPSMFSQVADEYDRRYGLDHDHLMEIARLCFDNARQNPNAQTRRWSFNDKSFTDDEEHNPVVEGRLRRHDCAQITDGAVAIVLASERYAARYAQERGISIASLPRILGFGHRTAPMRLADKLERSNDAPLVFPHIRRTVEDAWRRAQIRGIDAIDAIELHDCFTITAYMLIDHLGITAPGEAWKAVESGEIKRGGRIPINPGGGLIGGGHPVGATGVRMVLDAARQVTGKAGELQIEGARTVQTLNIGGSATTVASFVIGR